MKRQRTADAHAALKGVLHARARVRLSHGFATWQRALQAVLRGFAYGLQESCDASNSEFVRSQIGRRADAVRALVTAQMGREALGALAYVVRTWRVAMLYSDCVGLATQLREATRQAQLANAAAEASLTERDGMLDAERVHTAALGREMSQLAEHARAREKEAHERQLEQLTLARDKESLMSQLAEAKLTHEIVSGKLETAVAERRRTDEARDALQVERDGYLHELRKVEMESKVLSATSTEHSAHSQQQHARLLAEVTEHRRRLAAVESSREMERQQLAQANASIAQLQTQLQGAKMAHAERVSFELRAEQRREIHTVHAANQRLDDDAMLAFNAEILAFAKSNHIEIGPQRSRHSSPARVETPVRRHH